MQHLLSLPLLVCMLHWRLAFASVRHFSLSLVDVADVAAAIVGDNFFFRAYQRTASALAVSATLAHVSVGVQSRCG